MIKKIGHIIRGWAKATGLVSTSSAEKKLSELRLSICKKCFHSNESSVLKLMNGKANKERVLICTKCNCPCLQKSLVVDEKCPDGKW
jgi:superfamily II helicase